MLTINGALHAVHATAVVQSYRVQAHTLLICPCLRRIVNSCHILVPSMLGLAIYNPLLSAKPSPVRGVHIAFLIELLVEPIEFSAASLRMEAIYPHGVLELVLRVRSYDDAQTAGCK